MPEPVPATAPRDHVRIVDIRTTEISRSINEEIQKGLRPTNGEAKTLPTLLLYDTVGLKLFEDITYLEEYYLTNAEIEVLEKHADHIAARIQRGSQLIELGSGYAPASLADLHRARDWETLPLTSLFLLMILQQPSKGQHSSTSPGEG